MTVKLVREGMKLAVLGCIETDPSVWHIMRPGRMGVIDLATKMCHGTTLCGRSAVSNGYAADWRPPEGSLCAACRERQ